MPTIISAAEHLEPLSQGSLSRLCGLYSILNAVQLGLYPRRLTAPQRKRLFLAAVCHLGRAGILQNVLGVGMGEDVWLGLGEAVSAYVEERLGVRFRMRRLDAGRKWTSRGQAFKAIAAAVGEGRPVLAYFGGALDHYTVISGYADGRLLLFDSLGMKWVASDNVGLGYASRRRNWVAQQCTFALVSQPRAKPRV